MQKYFSPDLLLKTLSDDGVFSGYASVFNKLDHHGDIILPGAFAKSLSHNLDVKLLWQHDSSQPIGYFTRIEETTHGLYVEGRLLLDISKAKEVYSMLKTGVVNGLSIGFEIIKCYFGGDVRYIKDLKLWEISIVTFPANDESRIDAVKNLHSITTAINRCIKALI
jgi:HK97 family phage prohead protease